MDNDVVGGARPRPAFAEPLTGQVELVLGALVEGVTVLSADGACLFANEAAARLLGFASPAELRASSPADVLARFEITRADGRPVDLAELPSRRALGGEVVDEEELYFRVDRESKRRASLVRAVPVRDEHGNVALVVNVFRDVTAGIDASTLLEAERDATQRASLIAAASTALVSSLELDATLRRVAELAVTEFADLAAVDLVTETGFDRVAVEVALPELDGAIRDELRAHPPTVDDIGDPAEVMRSGEAQVMLDLSESEELIGEVTSGRPGALPYARALRPRSLISMPLTARGRTLGVLALVRTTRPFDERDVQTAQELAARAAVAVDNARLYGEAERARARLEFLAEASALLGASLDYERTLDAMARLAVGRVADWCVVHLAGPDGVRLVTVAHRDEARASDIEQAGRGLPLTDPGLPASVARVSAGGEPELIGSVPSDQLVGPMREAGLRSVMIVPLTTRGRTLGALSLAWAETDAVYDESDLEFAADLARRAADAIDNARLFRAAEDRAQAARVLASVGDGVFLVDRDGVVRSWNRAAAAATALREEDVVGRPIGEAIPGWPLVAGRIPVSEPGSAATRAESLPLSLGKRELWLSIHGVAVDDGTVYAFRDLTEDRALEEMRTEFVSTVSHELRTPLAAIYGAAMTLRRRDVVLDESQRTILLGVVGNEADRLARTVNDILWASRLDTNTLHVAIEDCDAVQLATDVVAAQRAHLPGSIELVLDAPAGLPGVAADPDKVRQVLVNLVDNAVKYSPDGGRVEVSIASGGPKVRFAVTDPGLGIPPAEQRRIFEKFYRLDPNMTRGIGGTGLGLYICRELLRRMNGRLWVDSRPGQGSTFTFELPVAGTDPDVAAHLGRWPAAER